MARKHEHRARTRAWRSPDRTAGARRSRPTRSPSAPRPPVELVDGALALGALNVRSLEWATHQTTILFLAPRKARRYLGEVLQAGRTLSEVAGEPASRRLAQTSASRVPRRGGPAEEHPRAKAWAARGPRPRPPKGLCARALGGSGRKRGPLMSRTYVRRRRSATEASAIGGCSTSGKCGIAMRLLLEIRR
jgi:hypothetical protein